MEGVGLHAERPAGRNNGSNSDPGKAGSGYKTSTSFTSVLQKGLPPRSAHAPVDEGARARPSDANAPVNVRGVDANGLVDARGARLHACVAQAGARIEARHEASDQEEARRAYERVKDPRRGREGK